MRGQVVLFDSKYMLALAQVFMYDVAPIVVASNAKTIVSNFVVLAYGCEGYFSSSLR